MRNWLIDELSQIGHLFCYRAPERFRRIKMRSAKAFPGRTCHLLGMRSEAHRLGGLAVLAATPHRYALRDPDVLDHRLSRGAAPEFHRPCRPGGPYSNMYVFGDSLSDSGNDLKIVGDVPAPDYYTDGPNRGRFTNGLMPTASLRTSG